jgi:two-component system sensor histidine kinase HydH
MVPDGPDILATAPGEEDLGHVLREYLAVAGRLQRTHEALQGEVVRLREELASKDRELELRRRLAALGELAAGVAHEVRNPLGAIQLYSGLLRRECDQHQLPGAAQLLEKIDAGIHAIDAVVQDTLALAPRDRRLGVCTLFEVIQRAHDASQKVLLARHVQLDVCGAAVDQYVQADENGLQRVLVNLIVNAAEAAPEGSTVTVAVDATAPGELTLVVRDQGPGLPDEIRDRIFDPFFTTKPHGTGLGLTIAHRLIEAYGGRLAAQNRAEGGAEFSITLPRAEAAEPSDSETDARRFSAA